MPLKQTLKHVALRTLAAVKPNSRTPLRDVKTFLILEHATALGSVIHTLPLAEALRAAVPDALIYVIGSGFGLEAFFDNPAVQQIWPMQKPTKDFSGSVSVLRDFIRRRGLREFVTLTPLGNERTAIALAAWRAGAKNLVGFTLAPELYRATLEFDPMQSQIANNLRLVEALGHPPARHVEPKMYLDAEAVRYAKELLVGRDTSRPLIAFVTQTSVTQRKGWRPERFVAAAHFLQERYGAELVFVGTDSERQAIESIRTDVKGRSWNVAGQTDLQQLASVLSLCRIGLTLDTGTLHIGRAVGLPMVVIAPAWSPPLEWLPLDDPRFTILKNLDMREAPPDYIIDEVSVDEVKAALVDLLERFPG